MNKDRISKNVMRRVIKYEKSHSLHAIEVWLALALGFFSLLVIVTVDLIDEMTRTGATDLATMMLEDVEMARDYWEILWETIKYDLPWFKLTESIFLMVVVWVVVDILAKRILTAQKKWAQMKKYFDQMDK